MSHAGSSRSARQVFETISKRHPACQTSLNSKAHISLPRKRPLLVDPFQYFSEYDVPKSWTSRISSLVRENRPREAVSLFKTMLVKEQSPNFVTVLSVIKAVSLMDSKMLVCEIHGYAEKMGFIKSEVSVVTALVGVYSSWDMGNTWKLFALTPNKDVILWSAMVSACVSNGEYVEAFKVLKEMLFFDVQPNHVTIASILPACAYVGPLKLGREIHNYCIKRVAYEHTVFQNALVGMYSKCGHLKAAFQVFNKMQNKDVVSWRIMIHGCIENECPRKALHLFFQLKSCYIEKADEFIIQEVIGAYSQLDKNYIRQGFHSFILKMGFTAFVSVVTELLQVYAKFGHIETARNLFNQLDRKDFISWSAMIAVYAQSTQPDNAFDILRQMQLADQKSNEFTFASLLLACSSIAALETGESIHAQIIKDGYSTNAFFNICIDRCVL